MKRLVEFDLEGGGSIVVEVDAEPEAGMQPAGAGTEKMVKKAKETFEAVLENVRDTAAVIVRKLRDLGEPPDELGVEFGVKMSLEGKAFIASVGAEANFKVALKWKKDGSG